MLVCRPNPNYQIREFLTNSFLCFQDMKIYILFTYDLFYKNMTLMHINSCRIINFDEKKCSVFAPKSRNTDKHVKLHFEKQFTRKC